MFKTLFLTLVAFLSTTTFAKTDAENKKDFEALAAYDEIVAEISEALTAYQTEKILKGIATRWDHAAMMEVTAKYVAADAIENQAEMLRAKAIVLRDDLAVEKEIWRRILGKNQPNPAIANEEKREAVAEALAGEWVIRSLAVNFRKDMAIHLAEQKKLRDEALAAEQERRELMTLAMLEDDFRTIQDKLLNRRGNTRLGTRRSVEKKVVAKVPDAIDADGMPKASEVRAQILREIKEQRLLKGSK